MKSIVLVGFMGTGKTTVGTALAKRLDMPVVDLDAQIVAQQHMEIDAIFAQQGEAAFRQMEHDALCRAVLAEDTIISPGGGAVLKAENRAVMKEHCHVVCLTARAEVILQRVEADAIVRPVLERRAPGQSKLERIVEVLNEREACYREADLIVDTSDASVEVLTERIVQWLEAQEP